MSTNANGVRRRGAVKAATALAAAVLAAWPAAAALGGKDLDWPGGAAFRRGGKFYYPDGKLLHEKKKLYYPSGKLLKDAKELYYPNGKLMRDKKNLYMPDGRVAYDGFDGVLVDLTDGAAKVKIQKERFAVRIDVTVETADYRLEYLRAGGFDGARLWALGGWHELMGMPGFVAAPYGADPAPAAAEPDEPAAAAAAAPARDDGGAGPSGWVAPPPPASAHHHAGGGGHGGGRDGGAGDDGAYAPPAGGGGKLHLCGWDFDALKTEDAGRDRLVLDRSGRLWLVETKSCRGGLVADGVDSFDVLDELVLYVLEDGNAWLLGGDYYFFVAKGVADAKAAKGTLAVKRKGEGWYRLSDPEVIKDSLRAQDDTLGAEIYLLSTGTFTFTF